MKEQKILDKIAEEILNAAENSNEPNFIYEMDKDKYDKMCECIQAINNMKEPPKVDRIETELGEIKIETKGDK